MSNPEPQDQPNDDDHQYNHQEEQDPENQLDDAGYDQNAHGNDNQHNNNDDDQYDNVDQGENKSNVQEEANDEDNHQDDVASATDDDKEPQYNQGENVEHSNDEESNGSLQEVQDDSHQHDDEHQSSPQHEQIQQQTDEEYYETHNTTTTTKTTFEGGTQFDGSQMNDQQYYHHHDEFEQREEEEYEERRRQYTQHQHDQENSTQQNAMGPRSRILNIEVTYGESMGTHFLSLEVLEPAFKKPFLGGYRHRKTGIEYHHASAQTEYISAKKRQLMLSGAPMQDTEEDQVPKLHRETQTVKTKTTSQQTMREQGTQMAKPGVVIDTSNDRVYIPSNNYFSSEDLHNLRIEHAIKIQAFVRGWRARKRASDLARQKRESQEKSQRERAEEQRREGERKRKELQRRMHPKTKKDFEVLYNELEQWRMQETERIKEHETDSESRRLAMAELLRKETKLLQTIDRLKQSAAKENSHEKINKKLEFLSKPKQLGNWDGEKTFVETPFTVRARELMDLYHGLGTPMLSVDERLDVLLHVKWTVKEFDCILTRDIVELIDREADLLNRGRKGASLDGLRKRLSNLFLQFIETPEFNPLSSKLVGATTKFANTQPLNA